MECTIGGAWLDKTGRPRPGSIDHLLELSTPEERQRVDEIRISFKKDSKLTIADFMFLLNKATYDYDMSLEDISDGLKTLLGDG